MTWLCHCRTDKCYCMRSVNTESEIVWSPMEGLTFTAKVCLPFSFTIQNLFLSACSLAAWQTSGRWGCIKCLTGGHSPRPQSWPSHHERIHYQPHPWVGERQPRPTPSASRYVPLFSTTNRFQGLKCCTNNMQRERSIPCLTLIIYMYHTKCHSTLFLKWAYTKSMYFPVNSEWWTVLLHLHLFATVNRSSSLLCIELWDNNVHQ